MIPLLLFSAMLLSFSQNLQGAAEPDNSKLKVQEKATAKTENAPDKSPHSSGFYHWDPYEEIQTMREQMDRIFNNFGNRLQMSPFPRTDWDPFSIEPQTDIEETDEQYLVTMNIPGADNSEIQVHLKGNLLSVSASTKRNYEETKDHKYIRMERSMGTIHRAMTLPGPVEARGMGTTYKDGVLTITIPKKKTEADKK